MRLLFFTFFVAGSFASIGCNNQPLPPMYPQSTAQTCAIYPSPSCAGMGSPVGTPVLPAGVNPTSMNGVTGPLYLPPGATGTVGTVAPGSAMFGSKNAGATAAKLAAAIHTRYQVNPGSDSVSPTDDSSAITVARLNDAEAANSDSTSLEDRIARNPSSIEGAGDATTGGAAKFESFVPHEDFSNPNNSGANSGEDGVGSAR